MVHRIGSGDDSKMMAEVTAHTLIHGDIMYCLFVREPMCLIPVLVLVL